MPIPNASEIARRKWTVRTCVRAFALLTAVMSSRPIISWLAEGISDGDTLDLGYYADRIAVAVLLMITAIITWFMQGLIARMLVPVPNATRCPKCNHRIEGMNEPICTECGLQLTPEFLDPTGIGGAPDSRCTDTRSIPSIVANRRSIVANIFRLVGILMLIWGMIAIVGASIMISINEDYFLYAFSSLAQSILILIFAALLTFWPTRLARFCVPLPRALTQAATHTPEIPEHPSPTTPCGDGPATG
ncbi:MAG: hypothetical protein CMJ35_03085 [Phycisphaerae bacterium]|nr:hypothetical protein [Phycisphaerae bacterium]MBM90584.1 hypothetical protein [Phycisphaerae bacterium]